MQRRATKRQTTGRPVPPRLRSQPQPRAGAGNGTRIRSQIKKGYEKARRDLEKTQRQLDQFHQTDRPQFTRWLNTHFGALLTELRELSQQMAVGEELSFQVQNEVLFGGGSYARAYQRVMERRENPEPPPPSGNGDRAGERDSSGLESGNPDDEEDLLEAFFKELFGEFGPVSSPTVE